MPLFAAQAKILQRLETGATGLVIRPAETVRSVLENKQADKSLYLMLHRYTPGADDDGSSRVWDEYWMTVVALKHVGGADKTERLQAAAGPYLSKVLALLDGWTCRPEALGRIEAVPGLDPLITDGYGYFPLLFKVCTQTEFAQDSNY